ncbi:MAG: deoxyribodipyrimidine photo-lyase [Bacteroidetes bacterium]|nr:MAG: deoxyribodipyrimidine photo-lyase [Bacteroidota bacterium]
MSKVSIFWFRRDLRLHDNAGLYHALKGPNPVLPLFIFDRHILDKLEEREDARVNFIHDTIGELRSALHAHGSSMIVRYGKPEEVWPELLQEYEIAAVYTNRDYEPYAKERDAKVKELLEDQGVGFHSYKDQVIFEGLEVEKKSGGAYTVFTPYSRMWKDKLASRMDVDQAGEAVSYYLKPYPNEDYYANFYATQELPWPSLEDMDFRPSSIPIPDKTVSRGLIRRYDQTRNFPALNGTSRLGIHFRFGTISIRQKARAAQELNETFLNELIWRDFYAQILDNYPHVATRSFRPEYDFIEWRNNEEEFAAWCEGRTGYPMVDAGMRQLNATGYMHNRVRMITASFLTKHLLIDWRWGEAYFAKKLLDFDLASNNGGWQWAAGSGTDAAPYFRIFNPASQQAKFDKDYEYVKQWVPEFGTDDYPAPIVDHKVARERCLETYKAGLEAGKAAVN